MSIEPGPIHGRHSRELCTQFLAKYNLRETDYKDVLETIINHDIKDYSGGTGIVDMLTILSVADDLDAFGFIGIFRYSEIYLTRGISPLEMGHLIKENAGRRFDNFTKIFEFDSALVEKHRKRYDILENFFTEYNKLVDSYLFGAQQPSGHCGVIDVFINLISNKKDLKDIYQKPDEYFIDPVICWFVEGFAKEMLPERRVLK
jgi:hypothetical protein